MSQPAFTTTTTAEEVATAFADQIKGKNVLITGTSINGIGFEAARVVARYANLVIITGYNAERLKLSVETIKKEIPSANVRPLTLDLTSLASVRQAAAEVNEYTEPLHVLIHNAASAPGKYQLTVDHLETQMAVDHISPFLFTKLLVPKLLAAATPSYTPRVVYVSSAAHLFGTGVDLNTVAKGNPETYTLMGRYSEVKSATILTATELSKRSKGKINAYSLHPGAIHTNMNQKEDAIGPLQKVGLLDENGLPKKNSQFEWKTIPQGAATTLVAAFNPALDAIPGAYLSDCVDATAQRAPHTSDPGTASKLWKITEEIIGEEFAFE
ncbi:NAD-P-binding protein [Mycena metata]|uniref:NAD-P-binding protein n=1 Tax=Mycena metata TaxID=1033252 RepID=A0AAD7NV63_9AGAR|nr:NAD-P-binding protein [Mycena metata]